jgi:acyl carrier protein
MTDRDTHRQKFVAFLGTIARPDTPLETLDDDAALIQSGLIDSLALLSIIGYLESEYGIDFGERDVNPDELHSIARVLDLIEREEALRR